MNNTSIRQTVEVFHLLFLDQLSQKLDRRLYAIKGGCNLRFFFNSIRYSEDMDIDVQTIAKETLEKKVSGILNSTPFRQILLTHHISVTSISTPKQTETTQRWKVLLNSSESANQINTKIEFSRRGVIKDTQLESVNKLLMQAYMLPLSCKPLHSQTSSHTKNICSGITLTNTSTRYFRSLLTLPTSTINHGY